MQNLSKIILITGTSSGFGKLLAIALANEGHSIIAAMRNAGTKNALVAQELGALTNVEVVEMDVTNTDSVNTAIEKILKKYGQIDILINNAGISGMGLFEATSVERMKNIFEVNVWGAVRGIQAVLPSMRKQKKGLVINISSTSGILSIPYVSAYCGSKFALEGMIESLQYEVKKFGIETINILPGPFPTDVGSKTGQGSDLPKIVEAYGEEEAYLLNEFGRIYNKKMLENKSDSQEVVDAVKNLIEMEDGTRPAQTVVNRMAGGLEQEYVDAKISAKRDYMTRMGYPAYL
ncbi:SDR family oxidoreductase [uncultured Mucilaginibacter sp.]|uniref:SDR family oxidoreductase n=1 Tax=uncultured Mucilaginibacter sp. TaxID=797541 RepID=UPI002605EE39|nr:SDR family oxidoreductase [uncultured Mucilaginibacter sp.]